MKQNDKVRIKSGRLKDCKGEIVEVIEDEELSAYRVALTEVTQHATSWGWRLDDKVDMDKHEMEVISHAVV